MSRSWTWLWSAVVAGMGAAAAVGQPVQTPSPVEGPDDTSAVAAAAMGGWYAAGDSFEDTVEVRDVRGTLLRTITRAEIQALAPWMTLGGGPDGPAALAWTASGRLLFIVVCDDAVPGDGLGSDVVLRYDASAEALTLFARLDVFDQGGAWAHVAAVHQKGRLYVGTAGGGVKVFNAFGMTTSGTPIATLTPGGATTIRGLAVDRETNRLYLASDTGVYRASLATVPPTAFTQIVSTTDLLALAWGDVTGGPSQRGLYVLRGPGGASRVEFVSAAVAGGVTTPVTPSLYASSSAVWHDVAATPDGALLVGADEDAVRITEGSDTTLAFDAWVDDEFAQVVRFGKGLMTPDCGWPGFVIDADTDAATARFHPASPDAAAWVVLLLIANDHLYGDPEALDKSRLILERYAGLAPGPGAPRSADGVFVHWINPCSGTPATGGCACVPGNWGTEYATLSTMKIVAAAARAMRYWPDDPGVVRAASRIIFGTKNWDAYLNAGTDGLYFVGAAGGGPTGGATPPFHEGIIFAEQVGVYGQGTRAASVTRWFNRSLWPTASYLLGQPITSTANGVFESAFISLYPALLERPYRADAAWRTQVQNIRWSNAAWTDDLGPRFATVFSAGTTRGDWGGYHADSLGSHAGDVTTFPSLLALCSVSGTPEAVAGYHAYRKGGRQLFRGGASILYRRSDVDRTYLPNSAGLPDVALGALGLAEVRSPGYLDAVLAVDYPTGEQCPVDLNGDGAVTIDDVYALAATPQDLNGDGQANSADRACLLRWLRRSERPGQGL